MSSLSTTSDLGGLGAAGLSVAAWRHVNSCRDTAMTPFLTSPTMIPKINSSPSGLALALRNSTEHGSPFKYSPNEGVYVI